MIVQSAPTVPRHAEPDQETGNERLERNTIELLNELRVAGTGVQVLFAFLLVVPFNTGFRRVTAFERDVYFVTLMCVAMATVLLIAPSIHHRLLFRQRARRFVVETGTKMAVGAMAFLALGLIGILLLISDFLFDGTVAAVVAALAAAALGGLWFAVPLRRRWRRPGSGA